MLNYASSSLSYAIDWRIKREPVYRLLDNLTWVDNFFETGELMLSSFQNFKNYPDEIRGDIDEGAATIGDDDENGNTIFLKYEAGLNAYVLSTPNESLHLTGQRPLRAPVRLKSYYQPVAGDYNLVCRKSLAHQPNS